MLEPVVIAVDELRNEILFPSTKRCGTYSRLLTQLEMSYLFTPEFIDIVERFQKHTGLSESTSFSFNFLAVFWKCEGILELIWKCQGIFRNQGIIRE